MCRWRMRSWQTFAQRWVWVIQLRWKNSPSLPPVDKVKYCLLLNVLSVLSFSTQYVVRECITVHDHGDHNLHSFFRSYPLFSIIISSHLASIPFRSTSASHSPWWVCVWLPAGWWLNLAHLPSPDLETSAAFWERPLYRVSLPSGTATFVIAFSPHRLLFTCGMNFNKLKKVQSSEQLLESKGNRFERF